MVTYNSLLRDTPIWLYAQNRSLVDEMPLIISQAEDQIFEMVDHDLFQDVLTGLSLTAGNPMLDLTAHDIREVRAIRLDYRRDNQYTPLERRNIEFLTMMYTENKPSRPRFYGEYGNINNMRVFPTPREDYPVEVTVNVFPPKLSLSVQENDLSKAFPRVYEKATLRQGALFMKNPTDAATYEGEMVSAIMEANASIARRRRDETGTRPIETSNQAGR